MNRLEVTDYKRQQTRKTIMHSLEKMTGQPARNFQGPAEHLEEEVFKKTSNMTEYIQSVGRSLETMKKRFARNNTQAHVQAQVQSASSHMAASREGVANNVAYLQNQRLAQQQQYIAATRPQRPGVPMQPQVAMGMHHVGMQPTRADLAKQHLQQHQIAQGTVDVSHIKPTPGAMPGVVGMSQGIPPHMVANTMGLPYQQNPYQLGFMQAGIPQPNMAMMQSQVVQMQTQQHQQQQQQQQQQKQQQMVQQQQQQQPPPQQTMPTAEAQQQQQHLESLPPQTLEDIYFKKCDELREKYYDEMSRAFSIFKGVYDKTRDKQAEKWMGFMRHFSSCTMPKANSKLRGKVTPELFKSLVGMEAKAAQCLQRVMYFEQVKRRNAEAGQVAQANLAMQNGVSKGLPVNAVGQRQLPHRQPPPPQAQPPIRTNVQQDARAAVNPKATPAQQRAPQSAQQATAQTAQRPSAFTGTGATAVTQVGSTSGDSSKPRDEKTEVADPAKALVSLLESIPHSNYSSIARDFQQASAQRPQVPPDFNQRIVLSNPSVPKHGPLPWDVQSRTTGVFTIDGQEPKFNKRGSLNKQEANRKLQQEASIQSSLSRKRPLEELEDECVKLNDTVGGGIVVRVGNREDGANYVPGNDLLVVEYGKEDRVLDDEGAGQEDAQKQNKWKRLCLSVGSHGTYPAACFNSLDEEFGCAQAEAARFMFESCMADVLDPTFENFIETWGECCERVEKLYGEKQIA